VLAAGNQDGGDLLLRRCQPQANERGRKVEEETEEIECNEIQQTKLEQR